MAVAVAAVLAGLLSAPAARGQEPPIAAYMGLAAWIDIYDAEPWDRPEPTVRGLRRRGVTTLFVQTSNYRRPDPVHRPRALSRLIASAHRLGMQVVAWYLPGFANLARDWRRVKAATAFETAGGDRFDGFALDIEATAVRDIAARNRRMLRLVGRIRVHVRGRHAVAAIIPDPILQRYWPRFPYRAVRGHFDVVLPMAYWTGGVRGSAAVRLHTCRALRLVRARMRDPFVPIHVIGGIADHAAPAEVRGFARGASACGAIGASLYDAPITTSAQWLELARFGGRAPTDRVPEVTPPND